MGNTTIRSSTQLFIDDNLDMKNKKGVNLSPGTQAGDAVEFTQMNTAIDNALSGAGNSIHVPVADLAASKAVPLSERADKMLMLIETLGLYRYDAQMIDVSNDTTIIRPTDIASDAVAGRWIKISSTITDHDNLSNILGNGTYHLSLTERDKLTGIQAGADVTSITNVGTVIHNAPLDAAILDADETTLLDSSASFGLKRITFTTVKAFLKTYFDTLYQTTGLSELLANKNASGGYVGLTVFNINFKNVAGTFTSFFTNTNTAARTYTFQDRNGTIADDTDITFARNRSNHTGTQLASTISDFNAAALAAAPAETAQTIGNVVNSATAKATLVDADMVGVMDSASGNILSKWSWANIKTQLFGLFSGEVSSTAGGSITLLNSAVIGKVLTGFTGTAGTVSAADSIVSAFNKVVGNINALGAASVATLANALVKRDANGNIFTDNTIHGYQSTATASGTTTITANSVRNQYFTGSLNQTLVLPVVTTLSLGFEYVVKNLSSGNITVQSSGLNTIKVIPPGGVAKFICIATTGTGTSSWDMDYTPIRIFRASLTGTINGSNTTFTVSALILSGTEEVIKNGYILNAGAGNDYTITYGATTTITFATAPSATGFTDVLMINYSL